MHLLYQQKKNPGVYHSLGVYESNRLDYSALIYKSNSTIFIKIIKYTLPFLQRLLNTQP